MTVFTIKTLQEKIYLPGSGEYEVQLQKEGAQVEILGGWQSTGSEKLEVTLRIVHQAPHTISKTLLRAVARDRAQVMLNGTIVVEASASNTNAFLTENILLLSPQAVAHAIPNLEIHTDAVKCSHAATISPLPEPQLHYLQTRGLTRTQAEDLLISGFLLETLEDNSTE